MQTEFLPKSFPVLCVALSEPLSTDLLSRILIAMHHDLQRVIFNGFAGLWKMKKKNALNGAIRELIQSLLSP